ncbi:MAG TPA: adenylate/guanylate cyclase domain-containing protein [Acidimicrobiia bacterium]|nr:adenylate/guanylate cyclase domain-containing protein [Acidimicrobiia bacterium]
MGSDTTCSNCGTVAQPGQRFCGHCGNSLARDCPNCGAENPPDHRFCGTCGTLLTDSAQIAEPATAVERRVVSVLFVDLVGFTTLSEGRDSEDVRDLITDYFDVAKDVVDHFGGTVDKFIGDAVMAWWGAETSNEDDAERAVRSALEIVDRVTELGENHQIPDLAARAGVMTGEASVGPGGNEKGLLLGDMVNATSRLQSIAEPGAVYIGDTTATLVRTAIEVSPAGTHQVKGKDEPIVAYRAARVLAERGGAGKADVLEPPFVGRDSELRLLKDSLHATGRELRSRLISLVGQGGIGKSRLVWELLKYVDGIAEVVYWHQGRSPSYGNGLSLWALGEMIRQRAGVTELDDDETTAARLDEMVAEFIADLDQRAWVRERLATLLGIGDSIGSERTELFAAARSLFEAISQRGTTVLVFEDLQWADPGLLEFIEDLPDWSQNHPILVITATRPDLLDRRPDWGSGRRGFASIYLPPLTDAEMGELVRGAAPGIPDQAVEAITGSAGGVPLFAVETLRMLLGDGRLVMRDGGASVKGDLSVLEIPSTVQAVIAARLDRLPPEERELARDAAVLGQTFTLEALAALREEETDKVERRLASLVRNEILAMVRDSRSPERGQYHWVQSLLREVAYARVSRADRHDLHLRAARYFRDLNDPELAPVGASHYVSARETAAGEAADLDTELREALDAALERALLLHAHEQVISLSEMALDVVSSERAADLHTTAARSATRISDEAVADRHVQALTALAKTSRDPGLLHLAMAVTGDVYNGFRQAERVMEVVAPHVAAHPDLDADPNLTRAAAQLARARLLTGDASPDAIDHLDRTLGAAEKHGLLEEVASTMTTLGTALSGVRPHQGVALIKGAIEICEEHGFMDEKLRGLINLGYASPDLETSIEATKRCYEESRRIGDRNHATYVAGNLQGAYRYVLRLEEAAAIFDETFIATDTDRMTSTAAKAGLLELMGEEERAHASLAEAESLLDSVSDVQARLEVERARALMALNHGDPRTCFEIFKRHFHETPFAPGISLTGMTDGAVFSGDPALISESLEQLVAQPKSPVIEAVHGRASAAQAIVEGSVEDAVELLDATIERTADAGMKADELSTAAVGAALLPDGPDRARFAEHARSLAESAGGLGLANWIDRLAKS